MSFKVIYPDRDRPDPFTGEIGTTSTAFDSLEEAHSEARVISVQAGWARLEDPDGNELAGYNDGEAVYGF